MSARESPEGPGGPVPPATPVTVGIMVLATLGGVLIILQSIYQLAFGSGPVALTSSGVALNASTVGAFGVVEGAVVVLGATLVYELPHRHIALGIVVLSAALLSLFSGGGLWLGALCGYVAGLLTIFLSPVPRRRPNPLSVREAADDPVAEADVLDALRAP